MARECEDYIARAITVYGDAISWEGCREKMRCFFIRKNIEALYRCALINFRFYVSAHFRLSDFSNFLRLLLLAAHISWQLPEPTVSAVFSSLCHVIHRCLLDGSHTLNEIFFECKLK